MGDLGSTPGLGRSPEEGNGLTSPVFWPGEFHGLYSPWGRKELDTTEQLPLSSVLSTRQENKEKKQAKVPTLMELTFNGGEDRH